MAANAAFHDAIARLVDNRAVYLYLRGNDWITSILFSEVVRVSARCRRRCSTSHKRIVKAIVDGNPRRAETLLRTHLEMSLAYCEQQVRDDHRSARALALTPSAPGRRRRAPGSSIDRLIQSI